MFKFQLQTEGNRRFLAAQGVENISGLVKRAGFSADPTALLWTEGENSIRFAVAHAAISTKFLSNCKPIFWLFSGWNCVANTFSFQTAEAKLAP